MPKKREIRKLRRSKRIKTRKIKKSRTKRRSRKFGSVRDKVKNNVSKLVHMLNPGPVWESLKMFGLENGTLLKLRTYITNFTNNLLGAIKPPPNVEPQGIKGKIENFVMWLFGNRIKKMIHSMTTNQFYNLVKGKYSGLNLSNHLLLGMNLPTTEINNTTDKIELTVLESVFGKPIVNNIKNFVSSLTDSQMVLFLNGKFNLVPALINTITTTKIPTIRDTEKSITQPTQPAPSGV